jgi:hypothetical protein
MHQGDLLHERTNAISSTLRQFSRLGEIMEQRLHLPDIGSTNGGVVHFEILCDLPYPSEQRTLFLRRV